MAKTAATKKTEAKKTTTTKATPPASGRVLTIDFTGVDSGSKFVRVKEGDYGVEIVKVAGKKGESSNKPYLLFTLKIVQGHKNGIGKQIQHNCSLQKNALWNLRSLLEACGMQVPAKAVKLNVDKLVGKKCAATIVDDAPYEGKIKSVISAFFNIEDLGSTSDGGDELEEETEMEEGSENEEELGEEAEEETEETEEEEEAENESEEGDDLFN